jgi:hypothetical protein
MELIRSLLLHRLRPSPDYSWVGSCIISFEACSAFTHVTTCRLTKSPDATLYTGGSGGFVASTAAPIVTGWSDPVPGRVFHPAVDQRLFTAHCNRLFTTSILLLLYRGCCLKTLQKDFGTQRVSAEFYLLEVLSHVQGNVIIFLIIGYQ